MSNQDKLLFICSRNQWRSPTAEKVYQKKGYRARSAGTSPKAKKTVSMANIQWADVIFVMEKKHKNRLIAQFPQALKYKDIHILDIPDEYAFMDPELVEILETSLPAYNFSNNASN